ncbi:MAG: putative metal-binding motif-containing protein [Myxococcales bacterium]|nr:putative metal-binding motif-containing protein [Myxococcales bacterium]
MTCLRCLVLCIFVACDFENVVSSDTDGSSMAGADTSETSDTATSGHPPLPLWYQDMDEDGFGVTDEVWQGEGPPDRFFASIPGDCDDRDPFVHPDGVEIDNNGADDDCDGVAAEYGWLALLRDVGGEVELWLVSDDAERLVRVTDGLAADPTHGVGPAFSWNAQHLAYSGPTGELHVLRPDGTDRRVLSISADWLVPLPISWTQDGRRVVYSDSSSCSTDLRQIDVVTQLDALLYGASSSLAAPAHSPVEPLVFAGTFDCGDADQALTAIDLVTADPETVLGSLGRSPSTFHIGWASDGSRFAFSSHDADRIRVYDLATQGLTTLYQGASTPLLSRPVFGLRDETVFVARHDADSWEIVAIDVASGGDSALSVPGLLPQSQLTWAYLPAERDPDCDRDGLGNGLDAHPGC